ncbi:hypothetical protein SESBI_34735 [Sesbania bispinosa]|nr:hypothetical protein SESBI_34735 [Sesbania bispinosa]
MEIASPSALFLMHDIGKDFTTKLETKSLPNPFNFGNFGFVNLSKISTTFVFYKKPHSKISSIAAVRVILEEISNSSTHHQQRESDSGMHSGILNPISLGMGMTKGMDPENQKMKALNLLRTRICD